MPNSDGSGTAFVIVNAKGPLVGNGARLKFVSSAAYVVAAALNTIDPLPGASACKVNE
jgi:hypothetical protein